MIIMDIYGGLGNQMFQYALGRHLSQKLNTDLKFDYSFNLNRTDFDPKDIPAIFDIFNLKGEKASTKEIEKFKTLGKNNYLKKFMVYIKCKCFNVYPINYKIIKETDFHFNEDILSLSNHCYLSGYWQSEKYFKDIENLIREDFRIKNPMERNNAIIAGKIKNTESVGIHLRGRDYITKQETKKIHFTCDYSFYERSINLIKEKLNFPQFFIFSDDPEWAKTFLKTDHSFTYVEGNSWNKASYEDLRLMGLCKHNIIANSSFSWWGAWLNQNPAKIVIAPKQWFATKDRNYKDVVPESWIKL